MTTAITIMTIIAAPKTQNIASVACHFCYIGPILVMFIKNKLSYRR